MKKIAVIVAIIVIVGFLGWLVYQQLIKKEPVVSENSEPAIVVEKTALEQFMTNIKTVANFDFDYQSTEDLATEVRWNTDSGEIALSGLGYAYSDSLNAAAVTDTQRAIDSYLKDNNFITDPLNASSGSIELNITRYRNDNLICNLTVANLETKNSSELTIACADILDQKIGGARDENGCLGPAGYSWNEKVKACLREWELTTPEQYQAATVAVQKYGPEYGLSVINVLAARCPECLTVTLQPLDKEPVDIFIFDGQVEE